MEQTTQGRDEDGAPPPFAGSPPGRGILFDERAPGFSRSRALQGKCSKFSFRTGPSPYQFVVLGIMLANLLLANQDTELTQNHSSVVPAIAGVQAYGLFIHCGCHAG